MTDLVERCIDAATEVPEFSYGNGMYNADIPEIVRAVIATIGAGLAGEHVEAAMRLVEGRRPLDDIAQRYVNEIAAVIAAIVEAKGND